MRAVPVICTILAFATVASDSAEATFTGRNGRIAIAFAGGCMRTVEQDGTAPRVVGSCAASATPRTVDWSPDGRRLLCSLAGVIRTIRSDGSRGTPVPLRGAPVADAPAFAPDGRRFAYARAGVIQIALLDGGEDRQLGAGSAPAWSPDGRTIAFTAPRGDRTALRLADAVTGDALRELAPDSGPPDWSPDGRALLYATTDHTILAIAPAGDRPPRVLARDGTAPVWSPDGRAIAFIRETAARRWTVWRKRIDGPARRILSAGPSGAPIDLAWQPRVSEQSGTLR